MLFQISYFWSLYPSVDSGNHPKKGKSQTSSVWARTTARQQLSTPVKQTCPGHQTTTLHSYFEAGEVPSAAHSLQPERDRSAFNPWLKSKDLYSALHASCSRPGSSATRTGTNSSWAALVLLHSKQQSSTVHHSSEACSHSVNLTANIPFSNCCQLHPHHFCLIHNPCHEGLTLQLPFLCFSSPSRKRGMLRERLTCPNSCCALGFRISL